MWALDWWANCNATLSCRSEVKFANLIGIKHRYSVRKFENYIDKVIKMNATST